MGLLDRFRKGKEQDSQPQIREAGEAATPAPQPAAEQPAQGREAPAAPRPAAPHPKPAKPARPALDLTPGTTLAGIYLIKEAICETDRWAVCHARHEHWQVDVTMEVAQAATLQDPAHAERIRERADACIALGTHPCIATSYYLQHLNDVPVFVSERVEGEALSSQLGTGGPVAVRHLLDVALQLCHALEYAHEHEVIHGGISAANVWVTNDRRVKLGGFGLAAREDPALLSPPERAEHPEPDVRGDVFMLGSVLYQLCCGQPPYQGTQDAQQAPPDPREVSGDQQLPQALADLLLRCVARVPVQRPTTVGEIRQELSALHTDLFGEPGDFAELPTVPSREADNCSNRAVSALFLGNEAEAKEAFEAALAADPQHLEALYNHGLAEWAQGHLTGSELASQLAAAAVPDNQLWRARYLWALLHLESGDVEAAMPQLEIAAENTPAAASAKEALQIARSGDIAPPQCERTLEGHDHYVSCLCLTPDGRRVISGSDDKTIRIWDLDTGECLRILEGHAERVSALTLNNDGSLAISAGDDQTLRIWNVDSGDCQKTFEPDARMIFAVSLETNGRMALLAAGGDQYAGVEESKLQLWSLTTGRAMRMLEGHTSATKTAVISPDGRWGLSGSDDNTMRLWDIPQSLCVRVFEGHEHYVSSVRMTADRYWALSGSWDRTLRLWETSTGRCVRKFVGHENMITAVDLSADGRRAVSGGWDNTVRLWDVPSGRCLRVYEGHEGMITSVAISPDGRRLLSGSWDKTVRVWKAPPSNVTFCVPLISSA